MKLNKKEEYYIIVGLSGGAEIPVYVYESSANEAMSVYEATSFKTKKEASQACSSLNQISDFENSQKVFKIKKITILIDSID